MYESERLTGLLGSVARGVKKDSKNRGMYLVIYRWVLKRYLTTSESGKTKIRLIFVPSSHCLHSRSAMDVVIREETPAPLHFPDA